MLTNHHDKMTITKFLKKIVKGLFSSVNKSHLLEYYQLRKNESSTLVYIRNYYKSFLFEGIKVFDIGANVGNYSKVFIESGAKVIAVEPQSHCRKILQLRFSKNSNLIIAPFALGPSEGVAEIYKPASHTIASMNTNWIDKVKASDRFNGEEWNKKEVVNVQTVDYLIAKYYKPDYIKIDVEGFELEVLKGLTAPVSFISFEITLPEALDAAKKCVDYISNLGNYRFIMPSEFIMQKNEWMNNDELILHLNDLALKGEFVSADIFCKLYE